MRFFPWRVNLSPPSDAVQRQTGLCCVPSENVGLTLGVWIVLGSADSTPVNTALDSGVMDASLDWKQAPFWEPVSLPCPMSLTWTESTRWARVLSPSGLGLSKSVKWQILLTPSASHVQAIPR